jgi:hypothetical protein
MPNRSGMHSLTDFHRQQGDYQCRHGIVNGYYVVLLTVFTFNMEP